MAIRAGIGTLLVLLGSCSLPFGPEQETELRFTNVSAFVGTRRFVLQPIDYVGEETLGGGRYTFLVSLDTTSAFGVRLELEGG